MYMLHNLIYDIVVLIELNKTFRHDFAGFKKKNYKRFYFRLPRVARNLQVFLRLSRVVRNLQDFLSLPRVARNLQDFFNYY